MASLVSSPHVYIWPLYGVLALKNLLVSDLMVLITGRMGDQPLRARRSVRAIAGVTAGKLAHLGWAVAIPLAFNPWWTVLAFYLACSWLVGFALAIVFQLAHCVDVTEMHDAEAPRRGHDFADHQLRTTADIGSPNRICGPLFRWSPVASITRWSTTSPPACHTPSARTSPPGSGRPAPITASNITIIGMCGLRCGYTADGCAPWARPPDGEAPFTAPGCARQGRSVDSDISNPRACAAPRFIIGQREVRP